MVERTDRELLEGIAALVRRQQADLDKIRFRTGCLYAAMLFSLIFGFLGALAD